MGIGSSPCMPIDWQLHNLPQSLDRSKIPINKDDDVIEVRKDDIENDGPWISKHEDFFIDLIDEEVAKQNKTTTTFTKKSWAFMTEKMKESTSYCYTLGQLKNKFNQLRMVYRDFSTLLRETSVGWDPIIYSVEAKDDVWKRLYKVNKHAKKFKKKGYPQYTKLMRIYGDTTAMGANAHASTQLPSEDEKDPSYDPKDDDGDCDVAESLTSRDRRPSQSSNPKGGKRGRKDSANDLIALSLASFVEDSKRMTEIMEQIFLGSRTGMTSVSGIQINDLLQDCMDILNSLEDIDGVAYAKALDKLIGELNWRMAFMAMPEHGRKD